MEVFFRAGGLMHISAILNQETMLSSGALKSMQTERLPGYGKIVVEDYGIGEGDLLWIVNAYGINSATIDAALTAKAHGAKVIGVSSHEHAETCPLDHPARHPSKKNLHDVVDCSIDCKVKLGDATLEISGFEQKIGALSTYANAVSYTHLSGVVFVGYAGIAYAQGMSIYFWWAVNIALATALASVTIIPRWPRLRRALGIESPTEYLQMRYNRAAQLLIAISGIGSKLLDVAAKWTSIGIPVSYTHLPLGVHGQDFLLNVLADAGLVLFQHLRLKFS